MAVAHVVKRGECLSSIAKSYGFANWRTIYDDAANADFKKKRPNPDLIYPGDVVMIPEPTPKTVTLETGSSHTITVKKPEARLRIQLEIDEAYAYELEADGKVASGQTDGKTPIEQPIPADLARARLRVWPASADRAAATVWTLAPGDLDPVEELSGVQGRLANLGYFWGAVDGQPSPALDDAVMGFKRDEGLEVSADVDDQTRARLRKRHDGL